MSNKCALCDKTVYFAERQEYDGNVFHGLCLQIHKKQTKQPLQGYYPGDEERVLNKFNFSKKDEIDVPTDQKAATKVTAIVSAEKAKPRSAPSSPLFYSPGTTARERPNPSYMSPPSPIRHPVSSPGRERSTSFTSPAPHIVSQSRQRSGSLSGELVREDSPTGDNKRDGWWINPSTKDSANSSVRASFSSPRRRYGGPSHDLVHGPPPKQPHHSYTPTKTVSAAPKSFVPPPTKPKIPPLMRAKPKIPQQPNFAENSGVGYRKVPENSNAVKYGKEQENLLNSSTDDDEVVIISDDDDDDLENSQSILDYQIDLQELSLEDNSSLEREQNQIASEHTPVASPTPTPPLTPTASSKKKFCTECGVPVVDKFKFCGECGTKL